MAISRTTYDMLKPSWISCKKTRNQPIVHFGRYSYHEDPEVRQRRSYVCKKQQEMAEPHASLPRLDYHIRCRLLSRQLSLMRSRYSSLVAVPVSGMSSVSRSSLRLLETPNPPAKKKHGIVRVKATDDGRRESVLPRTLTLLKKAVYLL